MILIVTMTTIYSVFRTGDHRGSYRC